MLQAGTLVGKQAASQPKQAGTQPAKTGRQTASQPKQAGRQPASQPASKNR
jgi:hypothetical protein